MRSEFKRWSGKVPFLRISNIFVCKAAEKVELRKGERAVALVLITLIRYRSVPETES